MTPVMLRQLWGLVETTQSQLLLDLDDNSLVQWLLRQSQAEHPLNHDETNVLRSYIHSRLSLIRDLARDRQTCLQ